MRQRWEYMVLEARDRKAIQPEFDQAGADGWERVSATAMFNVWLTRVVHTLYFKRTAP